MAERLPFGPSTARSNLTIRPMGEVMVDFDNNCIWSPLLTKAVGSLLPNAAREKLLAENPEFIEDALDLLFSCTNREKIIKATLEWIRTTTVAGYHGSRLIDLEVDSIPRPAAFGSTSSARAPCQSAFMPSAMERRGARCGLAQVWRGQQSRAPRGASFSDALPLRTAPRLQSLPGSWVRIRPTRGIRASR